MMPRDDAEERGLLGWGFASEPLGPGVGRDLVLREVRPGVRDLGVVSGMANLLQDLETALTTALGDDVFNTGFGFDGVRVLAGAVDPVLAREALRVAVVDVLRRDPRVQRIAEVTLVDGAADDTDGTEPADGRRTTTVRCVFEAGVGDPVALAVEGLVPRV